MHKMFIDELEELTESLISLVQEKKILYDASSNSNKNKTLKETAWREVALLVKMPGILNNDIYYLIMILDIFIDLH